MPDETSLDRKKKVQYRMKGRDQAGLKILD